MSDFRSGFMGVQEKLKSEFLKDLDINLIDGAQDWVAKDVYLEYEKQTYAKLINSIEAQPSKALQVILKSSLAKIYKRQK